MYKTREVALPRPGDITYKHIYFHTGLGSNFCRQKQKPKTLIIWKFYMRTKFHNYFLLFPCIKQVLATFFCYQLAYPPEGQRGHPSGGSAPFVERDPRRYYWVITHLLDQLFHVLVVSCRRSYLMWPQNFLWVDWELRGCAAAPRRCRAVLRYRSFQYCWHKRARYQLVMETGADMNSHLKGRDKTEITITWYIDLSFISYICCKDFCMIELGSWSVNKNVNENCNAQWISSDIKKFCGWRTVREVL